MEAVVGLLVALLGVSHGVETYCDGRQNRTQCYGALGGAVVLHLMDNAAGKKIQWKKNNTNIMYWNNNTFVYNEIQDRSLFTPNNGKIRITHLSRIDGGEYKLQLFDSNGQISALRILQLSIQAPVSSVLLVSECLSQGEIRVSCSSEGGDSPHYSWTLDGHTLTDAELLSGNNETNSITLKQQVSGNLVCSVRNQVSSVSKEQKTPDCGFIFINCTSNGTQISQWVFKANNTLCIEPTTNPTVGKETDIIMSSKPTTNTTNNISNQTASDIQWFSNMPVVAGVLTALVLLFVIGLAVICTQTKNKNNKPKAEEDNEQEVTYADVRIMQQQGRQLQQTAEVEVEYGQVRFSGRPQQTVKPSGDDCVYAKVHRDS
ncbi:Hemicentin-2 Precursor [Channa argus]|uniref:Hemicentin-2 n=1 Tax=Channa argus TaxID=215402 RepID=A0A6G1PU76_CHAAH|nr:Hemicentin-2 Precursor [Channa argus]